MTNTNASLKEAIIKVLDELPSERVAEVLDFALFLKQQTWMKPIVKAIPANHLDGLIGEVDWGGDALVDTERLYEA